MLVNLVRRAHADGDTAIEPVREPDRVTAESGEALAPRANQATKLVQLAIGAGTELLRHAAHDGFVSIWAGGHRETWPVRSQKTKNWLAELHFECTGSVPNAAALRAALELLTSQIQLQGREEPVGLRVAECNERLYLDLCDDEWRAVEIAPDRWQVIANPPIRFRCAPGMLSLPVPERGGSINSLRRFLNVAPKAGDREDQRFVLGYRLAPRGLSSAEDRTRSWRSPASKGRQSHRLSESYAASLIRISLSCGLCRVTTETCLSPPTITMLSPSTI
jgi:hypothetical protein